MANVANGQIIFRIMEGDLSSERMISAEFDLIYATESRFSYQKLDNIFYC